MAVLERHALTITTESIQCMPAPISKRRKKVRNSPSQPARPTSSRPLQWKRHVLGDSHYQELHLWKKQSEDAQCPQFYRQKYLRVLIFLTVCSEMLIFLLSFNFVTHCSKFVLTCWSCILQLGSSHTPIKQSQSEALTSFKCRIPHYLFCLRAVWHVIFQHWVDDSSLGCEQIMAC